ncbi:unnamed protein product [Vicia faba]|uniref:Uncharacterized protein n=1 Tax=Vicia faba TaxID=3906 RepID=A0AAV0ZYL8_VICFA|nr:unnamed protein product [Vicia faba]
MFSSRLNILTDLSSFVIGSSTMQYLGLPIFKGKSKKVYLQPLADKVISKLASWKVYLLSLVGRVKRAKFSIQGMFMHSMVVYDWSVSLLRILERAMKRFIWNGDNTKSKVIIMAWNTICLPIAEGGLGIRYLCILNEVIDLKLVWNVLNSSNSWASLHRNRIYCNNRISKIHIFSSLRDNWCGSPFCLDNEARAITVDQLVSTIIVDGSWNFDRSYSPLSIPFKCVSQTIISPLIYDRTRDVKTPLLMMIFRLSLLMNLSAKVVARNKVRFDESLISFSSSTSFILATVSTAGNTVVDDSHLNISDFVILKRFKVIIWPPRAPNIKKVLWQPPLRVWIKFNTDWAAISSSSHSACGSFARDSGGCFLSAFASFLGVGDSLMTELSSAMIAIEFANDRN